MIIFKVLKKKELITREEKSARSIKITPLGYKSIKSRPLIPFLGTSYAGTLTQSIQLSGQWKEVSDEIKTNHNVFLIEISGDSMVNADIQEGDCLLAQESKEYISGDIVVVQTPDGTTVKTFISNDTPPFVYLKPENPKYKIIPFTHEMTLQAKIVGKWKEGIIQPLKTPSADRQKGKLL